jgi:hypothetical protein
MKVLFYPMDSPRINFNKNNQEFEMETVILKHYCEGLTIAYDK